MLDLEGRVRAWNRAAEGIFGWSAVEILGHACPLFQTAPGSLRALSVQAQPHGFVRLPESRRPRKDASLLDIRTSVALVRDTQGQVSGLLAIAEDVTGRTYS